MKLLTALRREPSGTLFAVQVMGLLLYPLLVANHVSTALFSLFGIVVLGLVVRAVRTTAAFVGVALVLGVPASVLLLIQAVSGSDDLLPYSSALEAAVYFYAAAALIQHLLKDPHITRDDLFAIGATFTLVAWAFAYTYVVCQAVDPSSFTGSQNEGEERSWMELLYLSFTTLTSVGLSDIGPVRPFARGLVMVEQLAGLAYVAMLVSRLVALTVRRDGR
jgi:hypothetical protein